MHTSRKAPAGLFVALGVCILLAEAIYDLVFANLAYSITGSSLAVTTTYAIGYSAEILVTLLGAGFIDRVDKWRLFVACQLLNILLFALAVLVLGNNTRSVQWVWVFAFMIDLVHQYSRLILFALIPFLFQPQQIPRVNGQLATFNGVARALGPVIGAVVIFNFGLSISLLASIAFLFVALALSLSLRVRNDSALTLDTTHSSLAQRLQEGVSGASRATWQLLRSARWRAFLAAYATCLLVISVLTLLWVPLLRGFHLFSAVQTGYLFSAAALGSIAGGLLLRGSGGASTTAQTLWRSHWVMILGISLSLCLRGNLWLTGGGMFIFQLGATLYFRTTASTIQLSVPKEIIGSWYGSIDFISRFAGLVGILLAGWAYDQIGTYAIYTLLLLLLALSALNWRVARQARWLDS
ncbi:MFS transporter [Pseudomonas sp. 5P_3.1_Bac2]|uniref:MFS transporter n=1 Tax=Pseudomonas sp. 5P_3.1_Bac2 TaxID=2971617 RepID=UPI0021C72E66|nr:MFS transporter [Pseudomonas sp. 5P_3.1_Bac2]MCU1719413.1 MFS transporter [Pseudomonas sp. 5P_3.1_Bac2]